PLSEIRPEWTHPVMGLTVTELLSQCQDQGPVRRVDFEIDTMAEIL
ncbi:MAG: hypothetical protein RLZZ617_833, partial [Bacteroidota bacterium]